MGDVGRSTSNMMTEPNDSYVVQVVLSSEAVEVGFDVKRRTRSSTVTVRDVQSDSFAYTRGIRDGDRLISINDELVDTIPIGIIRRQLRRQRPLVLECACHGRSETARDESTG